MDFAKYHFKKQTVMQNFDYEKFYADNKIEMKNPHEWLGKTADYAKFLADNRNIMMNQCKKLKNQTETYKPDNVVVHKIDNKSEMASPDEKIEEKVDLARNHAGNQNNKSEKIKQCEMLMNETEMNQLDNVIVKKYNVKFHAGNKNEVRNLDEWSDKMRQ